MFSELVFFFFQAEDGIRDYKVTGVQTCALPILAEFESWDEANQYKKDRQHCGASILSVAHKPLEPAAVREQQPTDQPAVTVGGVSPPNGNAIQESKLTGDLGGFPPTTLHADGAKPGVSQ